MTNPLSKFDKFFGREGSVSMEMHRSDWVAIKGEIERLRGELGYIARLCPDPAWGDRAKRALGTAPEPGAAQQAIAEDVRLFGIGFAMHTPDGVKRLKPEDVTVRQPNRCLAMIDEFATKVCSLPESHGGPHKWITPEKSGEQS